MVVDSLGHEVEFRDYWDEDSSIIYWQAYCPTEKRNVIVPQTKNEEAYGKTTPYSKCPICHRDLSPEEYDDHLEHKHSQDQRDAIEGQKSEDQHLQDKGPQGTFFGQNYIKEEAAQIQAYQFTPDEFEQISNHAWEGDTCSVCQDILQSTEMSGSDYAIYPTPNQAEHMKQLFGYQPEPTAPGTGYLDPEDPKWQRSVEHIQERQKKPTGAFGPQSGMMRGEPTRDEWQVTSFLDELGVNYVHKMKLGELDPTIENPKIEFDIYIPDYVMAIETSPGWHEGGRQAGSFPQVTENDQYKKDFAKQHGIDLMVFNPATGTEKFINETLVPKLRAVGVDAFEVPMPEKKTEEGFPESCAECGADTFFFTKDMLDKHMAKHIKERESPQYPYREEKERLIWCEDCGLQFDTKPELNTHFTQTGHKSVGEGTSEKIEKEQQVSWLPPVFKYEDFEKGNPFNQQYIYREDEEGGGRFPDPKTAIKGPGVAVKKCPHGNGVFAERDFNEGELISSFQAPFVKELTDPTRGWATLRVGDLWWEEPASGHRDEWANFLDHDKTPNAVFTNFDFTAGTGDLMTTRPIKTGEEIYIDYGAYSPENIGDVSEDFAPEDLPPEAQAPYTPSVEPSDKTQDLSAGYDWDYNVKYREKPMLEEEGTMDDFISALDLMKKYLSPEFDDLFKTTAKPGQTREEWASELAWESWQAKEAEGELVSESLREEQSPPVNQNIPTSKYTAIEPLTLDQSQNTPRFPEGGQVNTIEQQSGGPDLAAENHLFQEEGRWDKPPATGPEGMPATPEDIQSYVRLADETGDLIPSLVDEGTITSEQADALVEYQTKAKEAIMAHHLDEGQALLEEMLEYLVFVLPDLADEAEP